MKTKLIVSLLLFFVGYSSIVYAQSLIWAKQLGGKDVDKGKFIAVDVRGNVYTTGVFEGIADFDPGLGTYNLIATGQFDIFISKLDSSGNFIWAKKWGSTDSEYPYSIAVDDKGSVYTLGSFSSTIDFDPGSGIYDLDADGIDLFFSKLDANGNFVWAKQLDYVVVSSMALDVDGNIYITGSFNHPTDFNPGQETYNMTPGISDIFISKFDSEGNFVWAKQLAGKLKRKDSGYGEGSSLTIDSSGNLYITGHFAGTIDFDPGNEVFKLTTYNDLDDDVFVAKFDSEGNFIWAKKWGGASYDKGFSITIDFNGNIYTTGFFIGKVDFDPGPGVYNMRARGKWGDIFIAKLDTNGDFIWAKKFVSKLVGRGTIKKAINQGSSIAVDAKGNIYTTGLFEGKVDFDPGFGRCNIRSTRVDDVFVSKLDANGNFIWARQLKDKGISYCKFSSVDAKGNVYMTGEFSGIADLDPGSNVDNRTASGYLQDIFVVKFR